MAEDAHEKAVERLAGWMAEGGEADTADFTPERLDSIAALSHRRNGPDAYKREARALLRALGVVAVPADLADAVRVADYGGRPDEPLHPAVEARVALVDAVLEQLK